MTGLISSRRSLAAGLALAFAALTSTSGETAGGNGVQVAITAVSGYAGHAFVYAEVTSAGATAPAPTGRTHQSPYYSTWVRQPLGSSSCPWVWAVYVFRRADNIQLNPSPANGPQPNFGTSTTICASPSKTPVEEPPMGEASSRLDLDLAVTLSPALAVAGSPSSVSAILSSALIQDLDLYLNMAIEDWTVTRWAVDFGDGQRATIAGRPGTSLTTAHTFQSPGQFDTGVIASIAGHAQAAIYDRYGTPRLLQQPFSVQIGNHAIASARSPSTRRYVPPLAVVAVVPSMGPAAPDGRLVGFRHIDTMRGALTTMAIQLNLVREATMTVDGRVAGLGRSRLVAWRFDGPRSDAPDSAGTAAGQIHTASEFLSLQWNQPDHLQAGRRQDYVVPITLFVETRFPDGHLMTSAIASSFSVSVNFAAESG